MNLCMSISKSIHFRSVCLSTARTSGHRTKRSLGFFLLIKWSFRPKLLCNKYRRNETWSGCNLFEVFFFISFPSLHCSISAYGDKFIQIYAEFVITLAILQAPSWKSDDTTTRRRPHEHTDWHYCYLFGSEVSKTVGSNLAQFPYGSAGKKYK